MMVVLLRALAITGALLLAIDARAGAPVFFQALDPVRPDETFLLFGADVTPGASAEGLRLEDTEVVGPPARVADEPSGVPGPMTVLQATDLSAKILIPKSWAPGAYAVRVRTEAGVSAWRFANRPALWWQLSGVGGQACAGDELRVFGKNLGSQARLWLVRSAEVRELRLTIARDYDIAATVPDDILPGRYQTWVHNGHGGTAGFGAPLELEITRRERWPATVYDAGRLGAKGDGVTDDTEAIRRALRQAGKNGGGVVFLPRGTYIVTGKLQMPPRTTLRGEGRDIVWLKVPIETKPFDSVIAGEGRFAVENLSIIARPVERLIASPDRTPTYSPGPANWNVMDGGAGEVTLEHLRLQHLTFALRVRDQDPRRALSAGSSTVALKGPDCTVRDCVIVSPGAPIQISSARRAQVVRNSLGVGRNGAVLLTDFEDGLFEENDVEARDLEGSYGGVQRSAYHVMFRANDWHDGYGQEREALVFDTPYEAAWSGRVRFSGGDRWAVAEARSGKWPPLAYYSGHLAAVVLGGRGVGQFSPITKIDGDGFILSQPFVVPLAEDSLVAVVACKSEVLIVENRMSDASNAMLLYSQSHAFVMAGNRCERTGGSYAFSSDFQLGDATWRLSYAFFNQWIDNSFREGLTYYQYPFASAFVGFTAIRSDVDGSTIPAIGNRFVGNALSGNTSMGVRGNAQFAPAKVFPPQGLPFSCDGMFERNTISFTREGIGLDAGQTRTLLRNNIFSHVLRPVRDEASDTLILSRDE